MIEPCEGAVLGLEQRPRRVAEAAHDLERDRLPSARPIQSEEGDAEAAAPELALDLVASVDDDRRADRPRRKHRRHLGLDPTRNRRIGHGRAARARRASPSPPGRGSG